MAYAGTLSASQVNSLNQPSAVKSTATPVVQRPTTPSKTITTKSSSPKLSKAEQDYQKKIEKNIKEQYQSGLSFLGGTEQRLQELQPQIEQQILTTYESQIPQLQERARLTTTAIRGQQEETRAQRESALASARRQFQEGTQRAQALFGGVAGSSAGLAQSELLAREQARQMGATTRQAQQNILGLEENIRNVEATTAQAIRQNEIDKQNALLSARDKFRTQLEAINSQRFQLAQDKANKQLAALQDFNTRRRQLEDFYTQQEANIENLRIQSQIGLENYAQQLAVAQRFQPAQQPTSFAQNIVGVNLEVLNRENPAEAKRLAKEIANNPALQQQYRAYTQGGNLYYVTPEGRLQSIPLQ